MRLIPWKLAAIAFLAVTLLAPLSQADTSQADTHANAVPGTVNYVEGNVAIGFEALNSKSIGSADLQQNQTLTTQTGKVEVLLTPGVFLRVGNHSSVKMISPSLTNTEVAVEQGHAMLEVAEIHPENDIRITGNGTTAKILKTGLYDFDARQGQFRVFDGEAFAENQAKGIKVKSGHEIALSADAPLKAKKFEKKEYEEGDLYRWSSLRSAYLAEANVNAAALYADDGWGPWGPGWWGASWYWDPWFDAFTFIPGDGIFYSPFGWGFYSPWWVYQAPFYGYYGYGYHPYYHHFSTDVRNWGPGGHYVGGPDYAHGIYHGPGAIGAFHSGPRMGAARGFGGMHGGGFHGGEYHGGGFHGGGFHGGVGFSGGGGFHGR